MERKYGHWLIVKFNKDGTTTYIYILDSFTLSNAIKKLQENKSIKGFEVYKRQKEYKK